MSGIFGATVIKGTRITDFTNTSASVGNVIPWGVGRFVAPGNVIWAPLPPKEQRKVVRQGKGGVKQETFTYTLSYSIAFSKGPIYGFWWIKRNGKIVYTRDPNAPAEDQQYAAKWLQRATLYNGGEDQLPDSTIESYEGMGQVTAHKDISSIVVEDDDVTNEGGAVPSYEACVIATPPEAYLTSPPFPLYDVEGVSTDHEFGTGIIRNLVHRTGNSDAMDHSVSFGVGTIRAPIVVIEDEEALETEMLFGTGIIRSPIVGISQPAEEIQPSITFNTAIIRNALVTQDQPAEEVQVTLTFGGGSIYVP